MNNQNFVQTIPSSEAFWVDIEEGTKHLRLNIIVNTGVEPIKIIAVRVIDKSTNQEIIIDKSFLLALSIQFLEILDFNS